MNRITRAADFRTTVRRGRRFSTPHAVVYFVDRSDAEPSRFGFIVSKAVGNSVVRHRVTRRLRAAAYELLPERPVGADVIVRALPAAFEADWVSLRAGIRGALVTSVSPRSEVRG